jgi:adenylosuccinate synthase
VGGGPFPTEVFDDFLVEKGKEYGTTTGRKRRCGWLDLFALRYSCRLNAVDSLALTKLDVLSGLAQIPVCTGYKHKGKPLSNFPSSIKILQEIEPVYQEMKGWKENLKCSQDLPQSAKDYLKFMEDFLEIKISILSLGPDREETIVRKEVWA